MPKKRKLSVPLFESLEHRTLLSAVPAGLHWGGAHGAASVTAAAYLAGGAAQSGQASHHHAARHQGHAARPAPLARPALAADTQSLFSAPVGVSSAKSRSGGGGGVTLAAAPYSPAQVRHAYGFDAASFNDSTGNAVAADGTGQTIAIVDAYDDPNIASNLATFDGHYGLPGTDTNAAYDPTTQTGDAGSVYNFFSKVDQNGGSAYPVGDSGWAGEIALDVEWAHAIAPAARILLVEANSNSFNDLLAAVGYARTQAGVVSMSWGSNEFSSETSYDSYFPAGQGVTFVASAGDRGGVQSWPAESPNVVGVGGTKLGINSSNNTWYSETGWSGSGGGTSAYESKPAYQSALSYARRSSPDVGYNADPNSGVSVYNTYGASGWQQVGGTSAGAPQWAALVAVADQGRALQGKAVLDGRNQALPALYNAAQVPTADFHDVVSGQTSGGIRAKAGYDQITGQGTPFASQVITDLVQNV